MHALDIHYVLYILLSTILPLCAGLLLGWALRRRARSNRRLAFVVLGFVVIWFLASVGLRRYAGTDLTGWSWAEAWAHRGKWFAFLGGVSLFLGYLVRGGYIKDTADRIQMAWIVTIAAIMAGVVVWRTVPVYPFLPKDTPRDEQGLLRQTGEYTCGPVALANLLDLVYGVRDVRERELARLSGTTLEGTTLTGLIRAAEHKGLRLSACRRMTLDELADMGSPAIVSISTLPTVRHAVLLVSIEGNGSRVHLVDPDRGYLRMTRADFEEVWYGKTLVFDRAEDTGAP